MNIDIYNCICNGNLKDSLYNICHFILLNEKFIILEITLINICSYIGTFINIYNIHNYHDIIESTKNIIENDNINITDLLVLTTKMCIMCNNYNNNITVKTGTIVITKLREKILDIFENNVNLSTNGLYKFESIIPPKDSDSYLLSLKIISNLLILLKSINNLNTTDNIEDIYKISDKLKNSFDYIIRKKYTFETKICSDIDSIWFIWGFISIICNEDCVANNYFLFNYEYKKTSKKHRLGLIYASALSVIYCLKKDISIGWNENETKIIDNIRGLSIQLFNEVKKMNELKENKFEYKEPSLDPLEFINNYKPKINVDKIDIDEDKKK